MSKLRKFKPLSAVTFLGAAVLIIVTYVAMAFVGWFGMFLIGVLGMVVTTRVDLHDGIAVADLDYGSTSVGMIARQKAEREQADWQGQVEEKERRAKHKHAIYIFNTIWLAMIALGLVMFSVHQI